MKDCKNHFDKAKGKGTMVFLCEGQSASGSITSCRDVNNQAVFTLKGQPLNVWDLKRDIVYKNDEMYNLMHTGDWGTRGPHQGFRPSAAPSSVGWFTQRG